MNNFLITTAATIVLAVSATAQAEDNLNCRIESVSQSMASGTDRILGLKLNPCTTNGNAFSSITFVWAPIAQETLLNEIQASQNYAVFTVTHGYFGRLLAINGNKVGSVTPIADREISTYKLAKEGEPSWIQADALLNAGYVPKTPEVSTSEDTPPVSIMSFRRSLDFVGQDNEFFFHIHQGGKHFSHYVGGVRPGFTYVSVKGRLPEGQLPQTHAFKLSVRDAEAFYQRFGMAKDKTIKIILERGTFACQNKQTCEIRLGN
ncbi:MAG: hypothetical protein V4736_15705 [Bdellovibrionota bacterium]